MSIVFDKPRLILCLFDEVESERRGENCGLSIDCVDMNEVLWNVPPESSPCFNDFTYYVSEL